MNPRTMAGARNTLAGDAENLTPKPSTPQLPPIIATHLGLDLVDVDGAIAWSQHLATAASRWIRARRAA